MTVLLLGVWPGVLFGILLGMQHVEDGLFAEPAKPPQRRRRLRVRASAGSEGAGADNELAAAAPLTDRTARLLTAPEVSPVWVSTGGCE